MFDFQSTVKLFFRFKNLERALLVYFMDFRHSLNGCHFSLKRMQLEKLRFLNLKRPNVLTLPSGVLNDFN